MTAVSQRDEFAHRADLLRLAKATHVLRPPPALLSLLAVAERWVRLHVQPVIGLTRVPVLHPALRDRLCPPADLARRRDRAPRPLDLFPDLVPGCLPHARPHELAAEYSLDFRL